MCTLFFFNDTATTEIYTLSLHDALPIWRWRRRHLTETCDPSPSSRAVQRCTTSNSSPASSMTSSLQKTSLCCERSEEHTSELQSQSNLVCRLLLEKKKNNR